jgi:large subunit ribosomal protein L13
MDSGDFVVVVNSEEIKVTGRKADQKTYKSHSGYPKGFKEVSFSKMIKEHPERVIYHAVAGMLPENRLKDKRLARLKLIIGDKNPYQEKTQNG